MLLINEKQYSTGQYNTVYSQCKYHRTDNDLTRPPLLDQPRIHYQQSISNANMSKQLVWEEEKYYGPHYLLQTTKQMTFQTAGHIKIVLNICTKTLSILRQLEWSKVPALHLLTYSLTHICYNGPTSWETLFTCPEMGQIRLQWYFLRSYWFMENNKDIMTSCRVSEELLQGINIYIAQFWPTTKAQPWQEWTEEVYLSPQHEISLRTVQRRTQQNRHPLFFAQGLPLVCIGNIICCRASFLVSLQFDKVQPACSSDSCTLEVSTEDFLVCVWVCACVCVCAWVGVNHHKGSLLQRKTIPYVRLPFKETISIICKPILVSSEIQKKNIKKTWWSI